MNFDGIRGAIVRVGGAARNAVTRFPLTLACALAFTAVGVGENHDWLPGGWSEERLLSLFFLGFFWTLAVKLWSEGTSRAGWSSWALGLLGLAFLGLRVFTLPERLNWDLPQAFLGPGLIALAIAAPFLGRGGTRDFWVFNRRAWLGAAFGFLVAFVLAIGLSSASAALEALFELDLVEDFFKDYWLVSMALVWPVYALAAIPRDFAASDADDCPRLLEIFIGYLLFPLALLYMVILYAYMARIVLSWSLPDGEVAWWVGGFASLGVAVHTAAYPLRETGHGPLRLFYRFFYLALFIPVAILAAATWVRIDAYGVTEARFLLVLLVVWLAGMALFFTIARSSRLLVVPASLAALLLVTSFGPWGAMAVSTRSQLGRLERLLVETDLLKDGRIVPADGSLSEEAEEKIGSILTYLDRRERLSRIDPWLGGLELGDDSPDSHTIIAAIGLTRYWAGPSFWANFKQTEALDVSGFDYLVRKHVTVRETEGVQAIEDLGGPFELALLEGESVLVLSEGGAALASFDLARAVEIARAGGAGESKIQLDRSAGGLRFRLTVEVLSGQGPRAKLVGFTLLIARDAEPTP